MLPYARLIEFVVQGAKEYENFRVIALSGEKDFDVYVWDLQVPIPTYEQLELAYSDYLKYVEEQVKELSGTEILAQQISDLEITMIEEQMKKDTLGQMISELEITILEMYGSESK